MTVKVYPLIKMPFRWCLDGNHEVCPGLNIYTLHVNGEERKIARECKCACHIPESMKDQK